jgi:hypothetical protein
VHVRSRVTSITGPSPKRLAAFAAALALALAGCGDDDSAGAGGSDETGDEVIDISGTPAPLGEVTAGSVAQLAQCRDWNRGTEDEKLATIDDIRSQVNLKGTGVNAPELTDDEAMEVFDNACEKPYAQGFRLYILYARAASFVPLERELGN